MSQSPGPPPPPDEPIIGGPPPTPSPPTYTPENGPAPYAPPPTYDDDGYAEDGYDDDWDDGYYEGDDQYGYYDDYDERPPSRQPIFWVFLALAAIVGAVVVFFIFMLVRDNGGGDDNATVTPEFSILIDSPQDNARIEVDKPQTFAIRAKSTQPLETIALLVDGKEAASKDVSAEPKPDDGIYHASLKTTFKEKREYKVAVRVTTIHGAENDSKPITIVAFEPVTSGPSTVTGKVVATVGARSGPGDAFDVVRTLQAGDTVTIVGRSADNQWLVIQGGNNGQQWVRAAAITVQGSLDEVPVVEPPNSPTPSPTVEQTPTATPTPNPGAPDFVPGNASLIQNGGVLQITVANIGESAYQGPLAIAIDGVVGSQVRVFNVNMAANGGTAINFALNADVTTGGQVTVTVDPDGVVHEARDDNNSASFTVQGPVIEPTPTPQPTIETPTAEPSAGGNDQAAPGATLPSSDGQTATDTSIPADDAQTATSTNIPTEDGAGTT
jgi:uncharacterized protein YraI